MTIKVKTQISKIRKTALLASAAIGLPCSALANPPQQPAPPAAATPASPAAGTPTAQKPDRSAAYYHFGLAHMYEDMATNYGRPEYATRAIEEYKLALDADPGSKYLNSGLAELYLRTGRVRDAVLAAQEILKTEPNNLEAHKLLGRVYLQSLGNVQNGGPSEKVLQLAIGEYTKIVELQSNDIESRLLSRAALHAGPRHPARGRAIQSRPAHRSQLGRCGAEPGAVVQRLRRYDAARSRC